MYPYKVIYLEGTFLKKRGTQIPKGQLDGLDTSKELEALIIEQSNNGFELVSVAPIIGEVFVSYPSTTSTTTGFMVTFKKKDRV